MKNAIFLFASFILISTIQGQPWMEGNLTPEQEPNFFQIQSQFEEYWQGKTIERGKGWKPFKRWEWYWQSRVDEDGNFPPAGINQLEYNKFVAQSKNVNSTRSTWESLGPNSNTSGYAGTGRINTVAFDPNDDDIMYVGAAGEVFGKRLMVVQTGLHLVMD